jgi:tRNA G18 (ribose-2'-O)-methylase SpoU
MRRGYYAVGIYNCKTSVNVGSLWRTAQLLDAQFVFTVGARYKRQPSDTMGTPNNVPLFQFDTIEDLHAHLPRGCILVGVELTDDAVDLASFRHPKQACYLLGAEDSGIPPSVLARCHRVVRLKGERSMNVAVAGSIVIYHRTSLANDAEVASE